MGSEEGTRGAPEGLESAPSLQGLWPLAGQSLAAAGEQGVGSHQVSQLLRGPGSRKAVAGEGTRRAAAGGPGPSPTRTPRWGAERLLLELGRPFLETRKSASWWLHNGELPDCTAADPRQDAGFPARCLAHASVWGPSHRSPASSEGGLSWAPLSDLHGVGGRGSGAALHGLDLAQPCKGPR